MKHGSKKIIAIIFFLIEISLPALIAASCYFTRRAYVEHRLAEYDTNKDGIWTADEQVGEYQELANEWYGGDGARYIFFLYFSAGSIFFGIVYKIIFFCGDKLKSHCVKKYAT